MKSAIYMIVNQKNGKCYVGSAVDVERRFREHLYQLQAKKHHSKKLQNAWNKYGANVFVFCVVEFIDAKRLIEVEQLWIDSLNSAGKDGYNVAPMASSLLGFRHSELSIEKCRKAKTGVKMLPHVKEALRLANLGSKHSKEHVEKIAAQRRGIKKTPEQIQKLVLAHTGAKRSEATRQRISESKLGKQPWLGKKHSQHTKEKISAAKRGVMAWCKLKDSDIPDLKRLRETGKTFKEIGAIYGVSWAAVRQRLLRFDKTAATELGVVFYDLQAHT